VQRVSDPFSITSSELKSGSGLPRKETKKIIFLSYLGPDKGDLVDRLTGSGPADIKLFFY
jgi:hypothetical protein